MFRRSIIINSQLLKNVYHTTFTLAYYGIAEINVNRTIHKIENILVKSRRFALPPKAVVIEDEHFNWVSIDSTETEIERPKKSSGNTI